MRDQENLYGNFSQVIELTKKDFDDHYIIHKLAKGRYGLIKFYAPWCGHCQEMRDLINDLADQFKYKFMIYAVNCENNRDLCVDERIKYYPTIKFFTKSGKLYNYNGSLDRDDIISFICDKL
jgi:protein disulfide-isomerase A6